MRIHSASSSEVFDIYAQAMHKHLEKRATNWLQQILKGLAEEKALPELLSEVGKTSDELIQGLAQSGKTAEEIAETTGKNISEVKRVLKTPISGATDVAETIADVAHSAKAAPMAQALGQVDTAIRNEVNTLFSSINQVKDLEGKPLSEVAKLYQTLQRSRNTLKNNTTQLRAALRQAEEGALISAEELVEKENLIKGAERLLNQSADEQLLLSQKVTELGGKLDAAGNVIEGLQEQAGKYYQGLSDVTKELELSAEVINDLQRRGIQLTEENSLLIQEAVKQAELAEFYRALALEAKAEAEAAGEVASPIVKATEEISKAADTKAKAAVAKVSKEVPGATETVVKATEDAGKSGKNKAAKEIKNIKDEAGKEVAKDAAGAPVDKNSWSYLFRKKMNEKLTSSIIGTGASAVGLGGSLLLGALKLSGLLALGAVVYFAYRYFFKKDPINAKKVLNDNQTFKQTLIQQLRSLKFQDGSAGKQQVETFIASLEKSYNSLGVLQNENLTEEQFNQALDDLGEVEIAIENFENSQEQLRADLISPEGLDEVLNTINVLKENNQLLKNGIIQELEAAKSKMPKNERGISKPIGREAPISTDTTPEKASHIPQIVEINTGRETIPIDIGKESKGFRSAAPRMISEILRAPEGLAFIDPDNVWGGWLPKTPVQDEAGNIKEDKAKDYLRALEYLYLNKIFTRHDLRKFVRQTLPKAGRKRLSGWKEAVKHYAGGRTNQANDKINQSNDKINENFTQKFQKPANYLSFGMEKKADQTSKDYYQVAITGLDDQYARSYYTGLKSMYDEKPSKTETDFKRLYEVHKESGADLIGQAHPFTIEIADAMGNGGVVENQIEQQRHNKGVAQSVPSGNFRGRHAWVINDLIKLADQADNQGLEKVSTIIDVALAELTSKR